MSSCIGIDIGTTHACVGVWFNNKVNIIANDQGFRSTPCYVSFSEEEPIVGEIAMEKLHSNASNTIFHLKRVLGKRYDEVKDESFTKDFSFDFRGCADKGTPIAAIEHCGQAKDISPEMFCSMVISKLKKLAEEYTGEKIEHCVITVSAHFTEEQKNSMRVAAELADINVLRFLTEPAAAAIAYGLDDKTLTESAPQNVVVFDLGGATHDVSLLKVDQGLFRVLAAVGDDTLGGEDFTNALVEFCLKSFERKHKIDIKGNKKAMHALKVSCESCKRSLSTQSQVSISVDSVAEGIDLIQKISRSRFEDLIAEPLRKSIAEIEKVLEEGGLEKEDVDKVILVGGSSQIPRLQAMIEKFFDGKKTEVTVTPDEAVAYGATIEAGNLLETAGWEVDDTDLDQVGVVPLSLGLAAADGTVAFVIERGTILPATSSQVFTTTDDNQTALFLQVYEGERLMTKDNTLVANFCLDGIPELPKGEAKIDVVFKVSSKGELVVSASEKSSGVSKELKVHNDQNRLTKEDVERIVQAGLDAADEDDELLEQLENMELEQETDLPVSSTPPVFESADMD